MTRPKKEQNHETQKTPSHDKRQRGRPAYAHGQKKNRSLYITDEAYETMQRFIKEHNARNLSELIERMARREIVIHPRRDNLQVQFVDISMFWRLRMLLKEPVSLFWSVTGFTNRIAQQLNLDFNENDVKQVVLQAMTVLLYYNYFYPEKYIDSPTAWLRWYIFHLLKQRNSYLPTSVDVVDDRFGNYLESVRKQQQHDCIATIYHARQNLIKNSVRTPQLNALKLRIPPYQLSYGQIERIHKTQNANCTAIELVHQGHAAFRELWIHKDTTRKKLPDDKTNMLDKAFQYCAYAQPKFLVFQNIETIEKLIKGGLQNQDHDFWANEIDYYFEYLQNPDLERYVEEQERIRQKIEDVFDVYFLEKKKELDQEVIEKNRFEKLGQFIQNKMFTEFKLTMSVVDPLTMGGVGSKDT